jgi:hypothetical protein
MNKEFIPYEEAFELKQLDFDEPCFDFYDDNRELFYYDGDDGKVYFRDTNK